MRLDLFLKASRLIARRSLAQKFCDANQIKTNGTKAKSLDELPTKAQTTIENVTTKTQIAIGTYEIDRTKFEEGLKAFRADNFIVARDNFERADMEKRDAKTQFYIADNGERCR